MSRVSPAGEAHNDQSGAGGRPQARAHYPGAEPEEVITAQFARVTKKK